MTTRLFLAACAMVVGLVGTTVAARQTTRPAITAPAFTQDDFFQPSRIWTAKFTFTPDAMAALEPHPSPLGRGGVRPNGEGFWLHGPEGGRNGITAARGITSDYVHGVLDLDGRRFDDVAVRYKGGVTLTNAKHSLKVDLNKYVKGQKLAGVSTVNFHSEVTDASAMNEGLSYRLFRDAGVPASRTAFARVYVTVTGARPEKYDGLYGIVENIDANFAFDRYKTRDGAILKPVTDKLFEDLGADWAKYNQTYDPKTDLTPAQKQRVIDFCRLVSHATDAEFAAKIADYLDLDNFSRYMAVVAWSGNPDSILNTGQNFYVYLSPATGRFSFIPWDQDHAFGTFQGGGQVPDMMRPWLSANRFLERVFAVPAFSTRYYARLDEFARTIFRGDRFTPQVDELAPLLRASVAEESAEKLARFESAVAGRPYTRPNGFPVVPIKTFAPARTAALVEQLAKRR